MIPPSGEFRIEGIPSPGLIAGSPVPQVDVIIESLETFNINSAGFGEWFSHSCLNPCNNVMVPAASWGSCWTNGPKSAQRLSNDSLLGLGSLAVVPGSIITLSDPMIFTSAPAFERVSRPVVDMQPRQVKPTVGVSITVLHNFNNGLRVACTINGTAVTPVGPLSNSSAAVTGCAGAIYQTTYSIPQSALPPSPIDITFGATERLTPGYNGVSGVNRVIY